MSLLRQKKAFVMDIFIYIIFAFILVVIAGVFIYAQGEVQDQLHATLDNKSDETVNYTTILDESFDEVGSSYKVLNWITAFMFIGMAIAIWVSSYMVTTKPVFFIVYFFIVGFAVLFSAVISNAYDLIYTTPQLSDSFSGFLGANFIMAYLPVWITVVAFVGAIIMFARYRGRDSFL
jgi:F0F1-type ATP synthase assembly protein I